MSSHLLWAIFHLFQEESQTIRDEIKDHGEVDESSEQQIHELAGYTVNEESFAGLNFCSSYEDRESFPVNILRKVYLIIFFKTKCKLKSLLPVKYAGWKWPVV